MKINLLRIFFFPVILIFSFYSCKKDNIQPHLTINNTKITINGAAQKGPFAIGTSISIIELGYDYSQTGKSFFTQITDNSGSFNLENIQLVSPYVQVKADGFYFNEVCGSNSVSQITLNCISQTGSLAKTANSSLNINLLTHLEKPRVEYLLSAGLPFDSAKYKAQQEVLSIFNISLSSHKTSELLDISQAGDENAALLAVSAILQGLRNEAELSTLLSIISNDIRPDGILNDMNTKSSLIDHALLLDTVLIRENLLNFYTSLNMNVSLPSFETYIQQFITNTTFSATKSVISYPETGLYGENILYKNKLIYSSGQNSLAGQTKKCTQLTIRIHVMSGSVYYISERHNMIVTAFDFTNNEQFFTVINPELPFDVHFILGSGATYLIEYFENKMSAPSYTKTITVN